MRSNVDPGSTKKDTKNTAPFVFDNFDRGTIQDPPAGDISNALADSSNLNIFPGYFEGRLGCRRYTGTPFPYVEGRTGYQAHKEGSHIVSDSGNIFTQEDVLYLFYWDDDHYELITEYVSATEIVGSNSTYRETFNGRVVGLPTVFDFHTSVRQWELLIGRELYTADIPISEWEKILVVSRDRPYASRSGYDEYKDKLFVFNGGGLFKVELAATYPIAYRVNIDPPNVRLLSVPYDETLFHHHRNRYIYSAMRIEQEGTIVGRQSQTVINQETGTNVADAENIDYAEVWDQYEVGEEYPRLIQTLYVPIVKNTNPQEYQWHLTHFGIYRTPDLESINPLDPEKSEYNDPNQYVWLKDLRICGAFYGLVTADRFIAYRGEFEIADIGSILELDTGERVEIIDYISETEVQIDYTEYYGDTDLICAAAIGNGRVFRATVDGDILTRTHGDTFTAADLRKTIHNSYGHRFYVNEYLNANQVRLHIDINQPLQGFTMDPTHRNFYDNIRDEVLHARKDFYSCAARYREAFPSCNLGKIYPGFLVGGFRGMKEVYYLNLQDKLDYLIGQHVKIQRSDLVQDAISFFWRFQDVLSIVCETSTWGIAIGTSNFATLPGSGETVAIITSPKQMVKGIGNIDPGSVREIEGDLIQFMTNEQGGEGMRQFNGFQYSENLLVDSTFGGRIVRTLQKTKRISQAIYNGVVGYVLWRKRV